MKVGSPRATVLVAALVASGCASGSPEPKMTATYENAASGQASAGRSMMMRTHLLENMAAKVNGTIKLPQDIALVGAQCGQPNAFWNFAEKKITICYEDANLSLRSFKAAGDADPIPAAINATRATLYHELAHAAIDFGNLPITVSSARATSSNISRFAVAREENRTNITTLLCLPGVRRTHLLYNTLYPNGE